MGSGNNSRSCGYRESLHRGAANASSAIALNSPWPLPTLVPLALVIRYGVVAREEGYLECKFGDVYRR